MDKLIAWCMADPIRLAILILLIVDCIILLYFFSKHSKISTELKTAWEEEQAAREVYKTSYEKKQKETNAAVKDMGETAMTLRSELQAHRTEFREDKHAVQKSLMETKLVVQEAADMFKKSKAQFAEAYNQLMAAKKAVDLTKKEVDANMGRIFQVDETLKVLVEKNKEKK